MEPDDGLGEGVAGTSQPSAADLTTFVLWNNQAGVGKSTLTFNIVCEYAHQFPERNFLVVDMCPTAHSSSFFLGGARKGPAQVGKRFGTKSDVRLTTGGLLSEALKEKFIISEAEMDKYLCYRLQASVSSRHIPPNVYIVCGDPLLELCASKLETFAQGSPPKRGGESPFYRMYSFLRRFIRIITSDKPGPWGVFIDANSAFTAYTRMALAAADQLILPCHPEEFSISSIHTSTRLLYGSPKGKSAFYDRARSEQVNIPRLRLVIANRFGTIGAPDSNAYEAMKVRVWRAVMKAVKGTNDPILATVRVPKFQDNLVTELNDLNVYQQEFMWYYSAVVPSFQGAGVLSTYDGCPITRMKAGNYSIENRISRISSEILVPAGWAIQDIVAHLEQADSDSWVSIEVDGLPSVSRTHLVSTFERKSLECLRQALVTTVAVNAMDETKYLFDNFDTIDLSAEFGEGTDSDHSDEGVSRKRKVQGTWTADPLFAQITDAEHLDQENKRRKALQEAEEPSMSHQNAEELLKSPNESAELGPPVVLGNW